MTPLWIMLLLAWRPATGSGRDYTDSNFPSGSENQQQQATGDGLQCQPLCPACPSAPACPRHIPPGYTQHRGLGYYKMHYEKKPWVEAKAACESEGGYLAVLNSQEEANLAGSFLTKYNIVGHIHIGFFDVTKTRKYITVLNEPLASTGYQTWTPGEPNNVGKENCGSYFPNQGLNDEDCNVPKAFLCELFA